jgi:hypothetical protein
MRRGSGVWQQFGFIFWREGLGPGGEGGLIGGSEWRRRCGAGSYGDADFGEEVFLTGGRADAEEADGLAGDVFELVRGVGGDVEGFAGFNGGFLATEGGFDLAFEYGEGLFEVVTMGWGTAAGRDVHVDEAEAGGCVAAGEQDGVCVADEADVGTGGVGGGGECEEAGEVVGRKCGVGGHESFDANGSEVVMDQASARMSLAMVASCMKVVPS